MNKTDPDIKIIFYDTLRPEVRKMAMKMEQKFGLHDTERGDPFVCTDQQFMESRQREETYEMLVAMGQFHHPRKQPSVVWSEAADRCNFILMEAVNYEREWLKGKKKS